MNKSFEYREPLYVQAENMLKSIGPGCGLSQFSIDLYEEFTDPNSECRLEDGLKQPHLTTHEGRLAVWGCAGKIKTMLEAVTFKNKNDKAFWEMFGGIIDEWGQMLDKMYFADGPDRPRTAIWDSIAKHA